MSAEDTINDKVRAILSEHGFAAFPDRRGWEDDDSFLWRVAKALSESIGRALPAIQPPADETYGFDRMTWPEREYSKHFFYHDFESLILPLFRDGWSVRRVHRQMVAMLRALIALDPARLSEFSVVIPSEEVAMVEDGSASASVVASSERIRLAPATVNGHMFRYGLFLGLAMALDGEANNEELRVLATRISEELGSKDPLERPAYAMDPRVAEEIRRMRMEREAKGET